MAFHFDLIVKNTISLKKLLSAGLHTVCVLVYSGRGARVKCAQVSNYFRACWAAGTEQNGLLYHNSTTLCPCTL